MTTIDNEQDYLNQEGGIPNIVKVIGFMVFIILVFTAIANLLPQVEGQAPKDIKVDLGALTMDSYIAMGETLFKGKGTCTLCHNNLGRAPDILLMNMEETTKERLTAAAYKGEAKDSQSYIIESMIAPSMYVVPGYGKEDDPSPMPTIHKAPIGLTDIEMGAIVAFLQAKDGAEPSVELPTDAPEIQETEVAAIAEPAKAAASAEEALTKYGCTACHAVLDSSSPLGPELKTIGSRSSKEEIRNSIINPSAVIAEGFPPIMPGDFADKMRVKELEMIVDFLAASTAAVVPDVSEPAAPVPATITTAPNVSEPASVVPDVSETTPAETEQEGEKEQ